MRRWEWDGRSYEDCVVFFKVDDMDGDLHVGGLSNMSGSFPLRVNGVLVRSSETLYQCMRFPDQNKSCGNRKSSTRPTRWWRR
jgi:hypothetical protein